MGEERIDPHHFDENVFNQYIGYNRTGKSSVAQAFANLWRMEHPLAPIGGFDPQGRFRHLINPEYRIVTGEKGWWYGTPKREEEGRRPLDEMRNALFIADDYRGMNRQNTTSDDLYALMEFRAEYNIDIITVVHSPGLLLEGTTMYISHYYIFYTKGRKAKFEDKIETFEECTLAAEIVKAYVMEHPEIIKNHGDYWDEMGNHRFPHVIVDTTTNELITQNIDEEWLHKNWNKFVSSSDNLQNNLGQ